MKENSYNIIYLSGLVAYRLPNIIQKIIGYPDPEGTINTHYFN